MWRTVFCLAIMGMATGSASGQAGLADLAARLGEENVPTGANVTVSQVEAPDANGSYRPNPNHNEFVGKTFTLMSGASGNSGHATAVGRFYYGLSSSIAPGITSIFCYDANGWIGGGFLRTGSGFTIPPLPTPQDIKIFNNSWIADVGAVLNNEILRRADLVVSRDDVLIVSGVNFQEPQVPLLSHMYNGISVGRSNGGHATGDTSAVIDGPGRMKPEVVATAGNTSNASATVSAASALMVETARTTPPLDSNPLAERSEVIKAVLLGGAVRGTSWSNNAPQRGPLRGVTMKPLDPVFGAGEVNVNNAHLILTGDQRPAHSSPPLASHVCRTGWDLASVGPNQSRYWRLSLPATSATASVIATWHRTVNPANISNWSVANFDLRLWRVDEMNNLVSLIGESGETHFMAGNVVSQSAVDNVELLYMHELQAGDYVIEVQRMDAVGTAVDVAVAWMVDSAVMSGDVNGDGIVNGFDLVELLAAWGTCPGGSAGCMGDLNCDGEVNGFDLVDLLSQWGHGASGR